VEERAGQSARMGRLRDPLPETDRTAARLIVPSWSWAGVQGVNYYLRIAESFTAEFDLHHAKVTQTGADKFGGIEGGRLVFTSSVAEIAVRQSRSDQSNKYLLVNECHPDPGLAQAYTKTPQIGREPTYSPRPFGLLPVRDKPWTKLATYYQDYDGPGCFGKKLECFHIGKSYWLAIEQVSGCSTIYRRSGLVKISCKEFVNSYKKGRITII
jgi:hypothetical protein